MFHKLIINKLNTISFVLLFVIIGFLSNKAVSEQKECFFFYREEIDIRNFVNELHNQNCNVGDRLFLKNILFYNEPSFNKEITQRTIGNIMDTFERVIIQYCDFEKVIRTNYFKSDTDNNFNDRFILSCIFKPLKSNYKP